ncbi:hypothetical protein ACFOSC_26815 [Streptantibioticus rubrisoli]|uniref:Uncharacterized protein n=1 Tax=Streptantibioticus rubrisoli TaxID=1387313 RepID=A0ABT1PLN9_9ACTN|nr:hypothetical protein [Streptantibioticus rubrisoli]MCQ4046269.1 hypothetical protein [Streptantibioticus rubrisoli]
MSHRAHPLAGSFHPSGTSAAGPVSASGWRVTTRNKALAVVVAELLGGLPERRWTTDADAFEVDTQSASVRIVIDGPGAVSAGMTTSDQHRAPQPETKIAFRLAEDYGLGAFSLKSASWDLAESVSDLRQSLASIGGEVLGELLLERVEFTARGGVSLSYCRPVVKVIGPWLEQLEQEAA